MASFKPSYNSYVTPVSAAMASSMADWAVSIAVTAVALEVVYSSSYFLRSA